MKALDLSVSLRTHGLAPVYLLMGEEDYLREGAIRTLREAVRAEDQAGGMADFNEDLLYGDECDAAEILTKAGEVPAFVPRRLIIVKSAEKLSAREGDALLPYLRTPCETTTLVFVCAKLDGRLKFSQGLKERAVLIDCASPPEATLPAWIAQEAGTLGVRLSGEAASALKELAASLKDSSGGSLGFVRRELEKLAAYAADGRVVSLEDVAAMRGTDPGASVFHLAEAIGSGQRARALRILTRNLDAGEAPLRILGSLVWQYRQLWKAKEAIERKGAEAEAGRLLRMPTFKVRAFLARFREPALRQAFRRFLETDSALKGGRARAPGRVLESLVWELCGAAGDAPTRSSGGTPGSPGSRPVGPQPRMGPPARPTMPGRPAR